MGMYEHDGWKIDLTPFQVGGRWETTIKLFPPGTGGPRQVQGMSLTFTATAPREAEIIEKALVHAKTYIDGQQPRRRGAH